MLCSVENEIKSRDQIGQSGSIFNLQAYENGEGNCRGASFCSNYGSVRACRDRFSWSFPLSIVRTAKSRVEWSL